MFLHDQILFAIVKLSKQNHYNKIKNTFDRKNNFKI